MGKYLLRSLRYLLRMIVIVGIVFVILHFAGLLNTGSGTLIQALFMSNKGLLLIVVLLALSAVFPKVSFTSMEAFADFDSDRQKIIDSMESYGYRLNKEEKETMVFNSSSILKRLLNQFDDTVTVSKSGDRILVEGMKKDVPRIIPRINAGAEI